MFWKAVTEVYLCYYFVCPTIVFCRLEKICYTIVTSFLWLWLYVYYYVRAEWNLSLINLIMEIWVTVHQVRSCFFKYTKSIYSHLIATSHLLYHSNWLTDFNIKGKLALNWLRFPTKRMSPMEGACNI